MKINVEFFAAMREQAGTSKVTFDTSATTAEELFLELQQKYNFSLTLKYLKVAINEEYTCFTDPLKDGDTVVFIPPIAGG